MFAVLCQREINFFQGLILWRHSLKNIWQDIFLFVLMNFGGVLAMDRNLIVIVPCCMVIIIAFESGRIRGIKFCYNFAISHFIKTWPVK